MQKQEILIQNHGIITTVIPMDTVTLSVKNGILQLGTTMMLPILQIVRVMMLAVGLIMTSGDGWDKIALL
jgi:hypothetical protein